MTHQSVSAVSRLVHALTRDGFINTVGSFHTNLASHIMGNKIVIALLVVVTVGLIGKGISIGYGQVFQLDGHGGASQQAQAAQQHANAS